MKEKLRSQRGLLRQRVVALGCRGSGGQRMALSFDGGLGLGL